LRLDTVEVAVGKLELEATVADRATAARVAKAKRMPVENIVRYGEGYGSEKSPLAASVLSL
jgi:hypothetical protein